jgi:hypothetical protein
MKKLLFILSLIALMGASAAQAAITIQENVNFPTVDLIISQEVDEGSAGVRDLESGANDFEANTGQTFTLDSAATIRAITLKSHSSYAETWLNTGDEVLEIWIGENDGSSSNFVAGATNLLTSVAITNMAFTAGNYYTFNLDSDVSLPAGDYGFQFQFQGPGTKNQWFVRRANGGGSYAGGGLVFTQTTDGSPVDFPMDAAVVDGSDLVFGLHSSVVDEYVTYADLYKTAGGAFPLNNLVVTQTVRDAGTFMRHTETWNTQAGQSFVLDEETTLSQLTIGIDSGLTAVNSSNNLVKLWIGEWDGTSSGDSYLVEVIDLTDFAFANGHYRIDFTDVTVPAGTNAFQLQWLVSDVSHQLILKRSAGDEYAGGESLATQASVPSSLSFPFNDGTASGTDLVFALHSASSATVAGTGVSFPVDNVTISNTVGSAFAQMRLDDVSNLAFGQTFTLASETELDALTLKSSINTSFDSNPHEVEIWIGTFTDPNAVSTTYLRERLDFADVSLVSGDFYKIDLTDITLPAGKYAVQMQWVESNAAHRINWALGDDDGAYEGGNRQYWNSPDPSVPFTVGEQAGDDMVFALHAAEAAAVLPYETWTTLYNLTGDDAELDADLEPDGLNNLMEYALGGNPTNDDASAVLVDYVDGDHFYYVYDQRTDDADLTFTIGTLTDLAGTPTLNTGDIEVVGTPVDNGEFQTVTNRTEMTESVKFIKLEVEKN